MRQRPQYLLATLAAAGHAVYFVDPREREPRTDRGVAIVPSLRGVPARSVVLYVHYAPSASLADRFEDAVLWYDVLDDLALYAATDRGLSPSAQVAVHHPELLRRADVVTASSPNLVAGIAATRPDAVLVENGVDVERFSAPGPRPRDLPAGAPIVGFHGAIAAWFDIDLFSTVASKNPAWNFVLVGPVASDMRGAIADVSVLANVFVLGERPSEAMPAYVQAFDVGAVWFRVDDLTRAVSPLKVFEYLACGVPVVSTPIPSCVGLAGVTVAAEPARFTAAISRALGEPLPPLARRVAADAAWPLRIEPLLAHLDRIGKRRVSA